MVHESGCAAYGQLNREQGNSGGKNMSLEKVPSSERGWVRRKRFCRMPDE